MFYCANDPLQFEVFAYKRIAHRALELNLAVRLFTLQDKTIGLEDTETR